MRTRGNQGKEKHKRELSEDGGWTNMRWIEELSAEEEDDVAGQATCS